MPEHSISAANDPRSEAFIRNGFLRIDNAFSRELAEEARAILWRDTGCNPDDPSTWTKPVVRLGMYPQRPFVDAADTPLLHDAFNLLVGPGRWQPCRSMGTFPVRFPSAEDPGDAGSHADIARVLAPAGEEGLSLGELARNGFAESAGRPEVLATGAAGTVYLCHPFLVHSAQPHRGTRPRFMAQPPLLPAQPFNLDAPPQARCPVEEAIVRAVNG